MKSEIWMLQSSHTWSGGMLSDKELGGQKGGGVVRDYVLLTGNKVCHSKRDKAGSRWRLSGKKYLNLPPPTRLATAHVRLVEPRVDAQLPKVFDFPHDEPRHGRELFRACKPRLV